MSDPIAVQPPTASPARPLRSAGAVFAGLVTIFFVTTVVDVVMHATGVFPPMDAPPMGNGLFALAFAYRFVIDVGGSWLTARLAPSRPIVHALVLGGIGTMLSVGGMLAMWGVGPHWYPAALAASALPCAWIGGAIRVAQQRA